MTSHIALRPYFFRFCLLALFFSSLMTVTRSAQAESQDSPAWQHKLDSVRKQVQETMQRDKLKAVLLGITIEGKEVLMLAKGESMTGVPATIDMHLRNGNIAVAYLGNLFYQLVDARVIKADDPLGKWLPSLPKADSVPLEMLLNGTSGYPDYMPMPAFEKRLYADPFHQWTSEELIQLAFTEQPKFKPGTNWNYAHTNFVILGQALEKAAGKPLNELMQEYVLTPFGMTQTSAPGTALIPKPVLHSFTDERGPFEDATYWNPSWTLPGGAVQTSTIRDTLVGFRAVGQGKRLTPESFRAMLAPKTPGMKFWTKDLYYAQGVVVNQGWITQAPSFCGLFGAAGYLPDKDVTVALWCTRKMDSKVEGNPASDIFKQITSILTNEK